MKKIIFGILISFFLVKISYCQHTEQSFNHSDEIKTEDITDFIKMTEQIQWKTLDKIELDNIIANGKNIFRKEKYLPEKYKNEFSKQAASTAGEGSAKIYSFNFINHLFSGEQKVWDSYLVLVTLKFDMAGRVIDFYWDKPLLYGTQTIDREQLEIFMRYVHGQEFWPMKNKGDNLFRQGRILSKEYKKFFANYLKNQKDDVVTYEFFNSSAQHAFVQLDVSTKEGNVLSFRALEAKVTLPQ